MTPWTFNEPKTSEVFYLPYAAAGSFKTLPGPAAISLMIVSISAGVTMNGFLGKCLMLPVTRNESSLLNATS